jgi:hypothetical protein
MENLDLAASFKAQEEHAVAAPFVNVAYEVINGWEDWVHVDPRVDPRPLGFSLLTSSRRCAYHAVWEAVAAAVQDEYPSLDVVQALPEWDRLRRVAGQALEVFAVRGTMPEDQEIA